MLSVRIWPKVIPLRGVHCNAFAATNLRSWKRGVHRGGLYRVLLLFSSFKEQNWNWEGKKIGSKTIIILTAVHSNQLLCCDNQKYLMILSFCLFVPTLSSKQFNIGPFLS
jgi:hypothetical protein